MRPLEDPIAVFLGLLMFVGIIAAGWFAAEGIRRLDKRRQQRRIERRRRTSNDC